MRPKKPVKVSPGDLSKVELDHLVPEGALAYVDHVNQRTQVYLKPYRTIFRSWDLYAQRGAGLLCIRAA